MNAFRKAILDSFADDQEVASISGIDFSQRTAVQDVVDSHVCENNECILTMISFLNL